MEGATVTDMPFKEVPSGDRKDHWDRDRSVTLPVAALILNRSRTTIWKWHKAGMPTELLGGVVHVNVGDLFEWRDQHGRRRGRARWYT